MRVGASSGSESQRARGSIESPDAFETAQTRKVSLVLPRAALSNPPTEVPDTPARGKSAEDLAPRVARESETKAGSGAGAARDHARRWVRGRQRARGGARKPATTTVHVAILGAGRGEH